MAMSPQMRSAESAHKGKALTGKSRASGEAFDPDQSEVLARGADLQNDRPRPSPTRYPVDQATFVRLKEQAKRSRTGKVAKRGSIVVRDKGEDAARAPAAPSEIEAPGAPLAGAPAAAAPSVLKSFAGIPATGWLPPDCTLAVGPDQVLVSVNSTVSIYAKVGGAPKLTKTLTSWFSNVISGAKIFDPKALYDQQAGRWVLLTVALGPAPNASVFLLSVSQTSDATGQWWNYKLDATKDGNTPTNNWADYPSLGVDSQALYLTANMFKVNGPFAYAKLRIVPKAGPYAGGAISYKDFVKLQNGDGSLAFTVQPCHTFGAPNVESLVNSVYPTTASPPKVLTLWSVTNPLGTTTLTRRSITVTPFSLPPDADQRGGGTPLDSGDVRVLNAVFRGGSVWCALTTVHDYGAGNVAAIQWFQVNATSGALVQQGIYGTRNAHYFYPGVMPDSNGNMIMVFSRSSRTVYAGARYTGRRASNPLGQLQASAQLKPGTANYTGLDGSGRNRWGDYAGVGSDPADALRVWFYSMYAAGPSLWATQIGAAKF